MGESNRIEYKLKLTDTFEKEVVAFLNYHEGGVVYVGIDKDGAVVGCQNPDEIQLKIKDKLKHNIVHNDYTTQNPPLFEIFSDRIEITSTGGLSTIKNLDDFFSGYSNPISREIMRIYKDLKLVEHLGSGLNRILKVYSKDSFDIKQNYMRNIFYKNLEPIENNEGVNEGVKSLYELIENYPNRKTPFFATKLNTSVKNIERWIKQLKDKEKIAFKGAPKTGGYVVKDAK